MCIRDRQYNFSETYQKMFALLESKDLQFSCRCIAGQAKKKKTPKKKPPKDAKNSKDLALENSIFPSDKSIVPISNPLLISGYIQFEVVNPQQSERLSLPIIERKQISSADLIIGKPTKQIKEGIEYLKTVDTPFEVKHSGTGYCYVFLLNGTEHPQLIFPSTIATSGELAHSDLIISKPTIKKNQDKENPIYLILENEPASLSSTHKQLLICLSNTPISELQTISSFANKAQLADLLFKEYNTTTIAPMAEALVIEQDQLKYTVQLGKQQVVVYSLTVQD